MVQKKPYSKNKGNNKPSFNKPMKTTTFKKKKMINKADLSCFTCGETGHFSKDCPERADRKKKARQVNTVTASNADGYGNLFTVLSVARDSSVLMGNGSHASVRGVGTVDLKFTSGKIVQLRNVQHVPTMNKNLGPIFARSFQKTEDLTKWGHEEAGGVAAQAPAAPTCPPGPRVAPALTLRLLKAPSRNPQHREPRYGKPRRRRRESHLGDSEIASGTLPERGFISGGLYTAMVASGVMSE
ncbi:hypothetical protein QYE76_014200 [Lolium multiflorum]|uniref:CCHC-type domain-containing protein n=1 Tax=Lolium multiflorum TaxID=4521 RepID=A0AAD8X593_LOLMU|nr:hypothetical protein QYE76_014200 [Lolium multiflorum]